jgi:nucleoside 2-deoxyribosyltransferase
MRVQTTTYDVFLSYSLTEAQQARLVERALAEAGLDVFTSDKLESGLPVSDVLRQALAESSAVVVVVDPQHTPGSNVAVEVGAAMAWHKPIYVVQTEAGKIIVSDYLRDFPTFPMSRLEDVVESVKRSFADLSEEERESLRSVYAKLGIPVDRLLGQPASIDALAREFHAKCRRRVSGERLVQELVRLRKRGQLSRSR